MAQPVRFAIRFTSANRVLMGALLIPPSRAYLELGPDDVHVRMSWAFSARIPRHQIRAAGPGKPPAIPLTAGAHGWRGRWLVNGSPDQIVTIDLAEPARAYTLGFPIRLKELSVSLEDPDGFLASLGAPVR
jgi:hypothetical protein